MKKKIILPGVLAIAVLVIGIFATSINAEEVGNYPPIVQKIADKFDLNVSEVQQVFDEERDERRAEKFALFADRLDDLVSEGKLTVDQKEAILDKHEELQDRMEEIKNLPVVERKNKMTSLHEEFKNWAQGEGLDLPFLKPFGKGFIHGFGKGYMMGSQN